MSTTRPTIAIVGSGPSGCYTAQFLRRQWPDAEITIFESLPAPYGLLRYGVASDHQGTKAVSDQFDRLFERDGVRLAANITIGTDLGFQDIAENFDVVVRATGLQHDRYLPIETDLPDAIVGAGSILKALNGHPDLDHRLSKKGREITPLGQHLAVIGMGNVAMDVVRILCKSESDLAGSDVDDDRLKAFKAHGISSIDIFGRSPVSAAKFDLSMLKEVLALPDARFEVTGTEDFDLESCKAAALLRDATHQSSARSVTVESSANPVQIRFHFLAAPQSFMRGEHGNELAVNRTNGSTHNLFLVDTVICATGFTNCLSGGEVSGSDDSWTGSNVFKVGWLNRNGKGTIAANRKDAKEVSEQIVTMLESGLLKEKGRGFSYVEDKIRSKMIDFDGWREIDRYECSNSPSHRCRRKLTDASFMVSIAQRQALPVAD
ncbi:MULTISPECIES: NAD(P)-binding protein [unclassified Burkholderia]|uniref:NAD(P)-binding protein n=1 Tax=unclassified Burkholderia TaxID=2613784 RepID=UPI002AB27A66|nr:MULTISPECIES: NAD(P)-binding protein [unclassified Burkholderia]